MAVSKVILNGNTLIDTTQKTVTAGSMLDGVTALKNDGTDITGSIESKTSSDLTASGDTVTAPAGYYASSASKNVASGSATTPATSITANPSISVSNSGLITATVSASQSVTPTVSAGYVSSGTAGTVTVSGSNTSQLTVYNGAHHSVSSGYTVTVSLTNPINSSGFEAFYIYAAISSTDYYADTLIGQITSPTGNTTVNVDANYYGICLHAVGRGNYQSFGGENISCTGGASLANYYISHVVIEVTGDGTVTADGIDWYDD